MADTNVSSSVLSIMASFTSGLDVFKKLRERRKKKKKRKAGGQADGDEVRLSRSLRQGPEDIGREYQIMGVQAGPHFAEGDVVAQTSLAEILLKLNTGLVSIITSFLAREKSDRLELNYRSLTNLSDQSRIETVGVLRQLYQRLLLRQTPARLPAHQNRRAKEDKAAASASNYASPKHTKVRGPTLARVVIQNSSKPSQLAIVRPSDGRKKSRSSSRSRSAPANAPSKAPTAVESSLSLPPTIAPEPIPRKPSRPTQNRSATAPAVPKPHSRSERGNASSTQLAADIKVPRLTRSTPRLAPMYEQLYESPPPLVPENKPPSIAEYRHRKETPTYYSAASGSTKLGEIPMHKWAAPFDFDAMSALNKEAMSSGWPLPADNLGEKKKKKKRGGLFGLFRRKEGTVI